MKLLIIDWNISHAREKWLAFGEKLDDYYSSSFAFDQINLR